MERPEGKISQGQPFIGSHVSVRNFLSRLKFCCIFTACYSSHKSLMGIDIASRVKIALGSRS
jgi:hypothetical protein